MTDVNDFDPMTATDPDGTAATAALAYSIADHDYFKYEGGKLKVKQALNVDGPDGISSHTVTLQVSDGKDKSGAADNTVDATQTITVTVGNENDRPVFTSPVGGSAVVPVDEGSTAKVLSFSAEDADGDTLEFQIRQGPSQTLFTIENKTSSNGTYSADLMPITNTDAAGNKVSVLDFESAGYQAVKDSGYLVNIDVSDGKGGTALLRVQVKLNDLNDETPEFTAASKAINVRTATENWPRGTLIGQYTATDDDASAPNNTITYSVDSNLFQIDSKTGELRVLAALDYDDRTDAGGKVVNTPCPARTCTVKITATDGGTDPKALSASLNVTINIAPADDSVSGFTLKKANPVPGSAMGERKHRARGRQDDRDDVRRRQHGLERRCS